jgi:hypothetical protein
MSAFITESTMSKRRRKPPVVAASIAADVEAKLEELAPAAQRKAVLSADGAVLRDALVQEGQWDDPDDKNYRTKRAWQVRGYRRVDPLLNLHERGTIDKVMYDAAQRLRDDSAVAEGARSGDPFVRVSGGSGPSGPAAAQLDALERVRLASLAIGGKQEQRDLEIKDVVRCVVLGWFGTRRYEEARRIRNGSAVGLLTEGLGRLVEWYDGNA